MAVELLKVKAKVWLYSSGPSSWHFVSLPKGKSVEIRERFGSNSRGWGSIPVHVTIKNVRWKTSIFPDKKKDAYILPLKADVRKKVGIGEGDAITFTLEFDSGN